MVRAKFVVISVTDSEYDNQPAKSIHLAGVFDGQIGKDGNQCEENAIFGKYTPAAEIRMVIVNPAAHEEFKVGGFKYVDFTYAE
jgi:hypothetical protein